MTTDVLIGVVTTVVLGGLVAVGMKVERRKRKALLDAMATDPDIEPVGRDPREAMLFRTRSPHRPATLREVFGSGRSPGHWELHMRCSSIGTDLRLHLGERGARDTFGEALRTSPAVDAATETLFKLGVKQLDVDKTGYILGHAHPTGDPARLKGLLLGIVALVDALEAGARSQAVGPASGAPVAVG